MKKMITLMSKFTEFFSSDRVPRWQVWGVGAVAFLASFGLNEWNYWRTVNDEKIASAQDRIESKLEAIERQTGEFQTFAGAFVSAVMENKGNIESRRDDLLTNIRSQDAAIDVSFTVFDAATAEIAKSYRSELRKMRDSIESVNNFDSMGQFWQAAADLLVARNKLLKAIETQAQTPEA